MPNASLSDSGDYPRARRVAMILAWTKTLLVFVAALVIAAMGGGQDPAGRAFLLGGFVLGGLYWIAFILPALLALREAIGRRVGIAYALLVIPDLLLALAALVT